MIYNILITLIFFLFQLFFAHASSWEQISVSNSRIYKMIFANSDTGIFICESGHIFRSQDHGDNWVDSYDLSPLRLTSAAIDIDNNIWVNGTNNSNKCYSYKSTNLGDDWSLMRTLDLVALPWDMVFDNNFGLCTFLTYPTSTRIDIKSNGSDWEIFENLQDIRIYNMFLIDSSNFWLCGTSSYISNYLNLVPNVKSISGYESVEWRDMHFIDKNNGFITGTNGSVIKTTDGGLTFLSSNYGLPATCTFYDILFINDVEGYGCGFDTETNSGIIYSTKDGGLTWQIEFQDQKYIFIEFCQHDNDLWSFGTNGGLFKKDISTDIVIQTKNVNPVITFFNHNLQVDPQVLEQLKSIEITDLLGRQIIKINRSELDSPSALNNILIDEHGLFLITLELEKGRIFNKIILD